MTRGAPPLTIEQKEIIRSHPELYASQIIKLEGMEGTTKRQVEMYSRKPRDPEAKCLAECFEHYIEEHGLPYEYSSVYKYIKYLKAQD